MELPLTDVDTLLAAAARKVGESPLFEDWGKAVEEYRRQNNTIPAADRTAASRIDDDLTAWATEQNL